MALVVDAVIIGIVLAIIGIVLAIIGGVVASSFFFGGFAPLAFLHGPFVVVAGILLILYFPLMESTYGASLGKRFLGFKVVSKTGGRPTFVEAFIRNISKIYWLLLLLDVIVGLAVSKGYQQKYSDQLAGTSVVPA